MKTSQYQPTEEQEQAYIFQWAEIMAFQVPELELLHHIPNGGMRSKAEAVRFKRTGVKAGVPDLCLPVARKGYHGLYIELKRQKGGKLSEDQKKWLDDLFAQGYLAVRCDGADEAIGILSNYLGVKEGAEQW